MTHIETLEYIHKKLLGTEILTMKTIDIVYLIQEASIAMLNVDKEDLPRAEELCYNIGQACKMEADRRDAIKKGKVQ